MNRKPNKWCKRYKNVRKRISAVQTFFNIFLSMLHFWYPIYYWSLKGEAVKNWGGCIAQKLSSFFSELALCTMYITGRCALYKTELLWYVMGMLEVKGDFFYIVNTALRIRHFVCTDIMAYTSNNIHQEETYFVTKKSTKFILRYY